MANLVSLSKRPSGGYSLVVEGSGDFELSSVQYSTNNSGISLFNANGNFLVKRDASLWTVNGVTSFTTNVQVANALDGIGAGKVQSQQLDASGNVLLPSGTQTRLTLEITRPANVLDYAANDVINTVVANVKKKETVTITGTNGTVNLSIPNIANRTVPFTIDPTITAAKFVTDYAADYLPLVVVTSAGPDVIFEAATAGVDFLDVVKAVTGDMTATIVHTTANATLVMSQFEGDAVLTNGGTCMITAAFLEAPAKFASQIMTLRLYNDIPATILGDNVPFVLDTTNVLKRNGYIEMELKPVINSAAVVSCTAVPFMSFKANNNSKKMYAILLSGGAVVAPESAGKFTVVLNVTQL